MNRRKIELLAPAGSFESFEAAIGAGADAVYVGGASFGARAYAQNFDREELLQAINVAHMHNKKVYLTVNTLLKNRELEEQLYDYLIPYYEEGLDAVIVQDFGVLRFIRRNFPDLHVHASTQMTVTGPEGMKFLEKKGVTRVVAARELGLMELQEMHRQSPLEIEAFVHGALCYCYSGQCLMSSMIGERSGNRGRCAQTCRLPYQVSMDKKTYKGGTEFCPLSLKDICTIDLLPAILDAGVSSLKIEGRMKQPKYTAGVTGIYRKYLDRLLQEGTERYEVEERDRKFLLDIFSRGGSCTGYFRQYNGPSMMAFDNTKKSADVAVKITERKEKIYGNLILFSGSPAILNISCGETQVTVSGGEVQYARSQPMDRKRIYQQMEKLGNTRFQWEKLEIQMDDAVFVPVKMLNELRREGIAQLEQKLTEPYRRIANRKKYDEKAQIPVPSGISHKGFFVSCETSEQARLLSTCREVIGMYLPYDVMKECMDKEIYKDKQLYLALPHIVRGQPPKGYIQQAQEWIAQGMRGFLVRNLEAYGILKEAGMEDKCVIDHSLYTWNQEAIEFFREEHVLRNTVPLELNEKELRHRDNCSSEMLIYGNLPLMLSAQCVRKNCYQCDKKEARVYLKDRYGKVFSCACVCHPWKTETTNKVDFCYNILYNSIPYGILKEKEQVLNLGLDGLRLAFTTESPEEARNILKEFYAVYFEDTASSEKNYTKGHFKRGAR